MTNFRVLFTPGDVDKIIEETDREFTTVEEAETFLRDKGWRKAFTEDKEFIGWCKPWMRPVSVLELNEALAAAKKE